MKLSNIGSFDLKRRNKNTIYRLTQIESECCPSNAEAFSYEEVKGITSYPVSRSKFETFDDYAVALLKYHANSGNWIYNLKGNNIEVKVEVIQCKHCNGKCRELYRECF